MKKKNKFGFSGISIYCPQGIKLRQWEYSCTQMVPLLWGNGFGSSWIEDSIFYEVKQRHNHRACQLCTYPKLSSKLSLFCEFVHKHWKPRWNGIFLELIQGKEGGFYSHLDRDNSFYMWLLEESSPGGTINL